jgi:hypothetical protein
LAHNNKLAGIRPDKYEVNMTPNRREFLLALGLSSSAALEAGQSTLTETSDKGGVWCRLNERLSVLVLAPEIVLAHRPSIGDVMCRRTSSSIHRDGSSTVVECRYRLDTAEYSCDLDCRLKLTTEARAGRLHLVVEGELGAEKPLSADVRVRIPFQMEGVPPSAVVLPLRNGVVAAQETSKSAGAFWHLGRGSSRDGSQLALPLVSLKLEGNESLSIARDPYAGMQFRIQEPGRKEKEKRFGFTCETCYAATLLRGAREKWTMVLALHPDAVEQSFETFYATIPDIHAGPAWVHDIRLNYYDYIADAGQSLEPDLNELARRIPEKFRKHVVVCLHGYYDYVGRYSFNQKTGRIDDAWKSYDERARLMSVTRDELRRRLRLVKSLGFRSALYFADALGYEDAFPEFNKDWIWRDERGAPVPWWYWQKRPDSAGHKNYSLDPSNPRVRQWFVEYTRALITEFGRDMDALVWDETHCINQGDVAATGAGIVPADRAMMRLVADITREVQKGWSVNPDLAFLLSDNIDAFKLGARVPFALVAHGTWQDSGCAPQAWAPGLLPNFRNCLISCNWSPVTNREWNRIAVEKYGLPQGLSNGYGDQLGPSKMPKEVLDTTIARFLKQCQEGRPRTRYLVPDDVRR